MMAERGSRGREAGDQGSSISDELVAPSGEAGVGVPEATDVVERTDPESSARQTNYEGRFTLRDRGLRQHAARGVIVNSAFQVALIGLGLFQKLAVAALLSVEEFGFWGLLVATLATLAALKQVGINDKYIQQDEDDQLAAYQKAFTFELLYSTAFYAFCAALLPVYALAYDRPEILLPGLVLCLVLPASAFLTPVWIHYRRMEFVRQRILLAIGPVIQTIVTISLAIAGAGYWSLVAGSLAGTLAGGAVAVVVSPYPLGFRFDRHAARDYFSFSWPLALNSLAGLIAVQGAVIIGNFTVGLEGLGAIGIAATFAVFVNKVDAVIKQTMYPAVCAVKNRMELLHEAFVKSNRLAMMWGLPFGIGLALFGPDLVTFVLGEKWRIAEPLLQAFGLILGFNQLAFNWTLFMRALDRTRPIAVEGIATLIAFLVVTAPLMVLIELDGYVIGAAIGGFVQLLVRAHYTTTLFPGFRFWRHAARAVAPSVPAVALVLGGRLLIDGERTVGIALGELTLYCIVTGLATWALERDLLQEVAGYLRRAGRGNPVRPAPVG